MRTTPQVALATLEREVDALAADSGRADAMLVRRLDAVLELLPLVGEAARRPPFVDDRAAVVEALGSMQEAVRRLEEALQTEMRRVGAELAQVNAAREATAGYDQARAGGPRQHFDRVG
jgi:hypothetical protein